MILKKGIILKFSLIFLIPHFAFAGLQIGLSTNYLKINDGYERDSSLSSPTINIGYNYAYGDFVLTATTSRLFNKTQRQTIRKNGVAFESKTKITADTLVLGYRLNKFIPSVFLTNAGVKKSLYRNGFLGKTEQRSILGGLGTTYLYDKNLNFTTFLIAPNQELDLDWGITFGINYNL